METQTLLYRSQSLIGKTISADGWQYDNSGFIHGVITEVKLGRYGDMEYIVCVKPLSERSMNDFTFKRRHMEYLLSDGELPIANKFLNTGTNAKLIQ